MSELLRFFKDMRDNGYGLAEIAAQLGAYMYNEKRKKSQGNQ